MTSATNESRANRAYKALREYIGDEGRMKYLDDEQVRGEAIADLVCDLLHLTVQTSDIRPFDMLRRAFSNFTEELEEGQ